MNMPNIPRTDIPHIARVQALNYWNIQDEVRNEWIDKHFMLVMQGIEIADKLEYGEIRMDGVSYKINWITPATDCFRNSQVYCSFRRLKGEDVGVVIIKVMPKTKYQYGEKE